MMEKEKVDLINLGPCFWDGNRKNGALGIPHQSDRSRHINSFDKQIDHYPVELCKTGQLRCDVVDLFDQAGGYSYINGPV